MTLRLKNELKNDRVLYRIRGDKDNIDILTEHSESSKPTVLASPSLSFGVDLKGDMKIIAKNYCNRECMAEGRSKLGV